jgi:hypothetical protein
MTAFAAMIALLGYSAPGCIYTPPLEATRGDIIGAFLEFEAAERAKPPAEERLRSLNQEFDSATLLFFGGNLFRAVQSLDQLTLQLHSLPANQADAIVSSLKLIPAERVRVLKEGESASTEPLRVRIGSLYVVQNGLSGIRPALRVRIGEETASSQTLSISSPFVWRVDSTINVQPPASGWAPGSYTLDLVSESGAAWGRARWFVARRSFDTVRQELLDRLAKLPAGGPISAQTRAIATARINLLNDILDEANTARFLADLTKLESELLTEVASLEQGTDPYLRRGGDHWRAVAIEGSSDPIPMRVYAPATAFADRPVPLVIALHGAGVDENMFLDGYGAGELGRLAEARGFIVASPYTYPIAARPELINAVVDSMQEHYAIDSARIYLIGHSLGGITVGAIAAQNDGRIAAAVMIAGASQLDRGQSRLPRLVFGGGLDPLVPAQTLKSFATTARDNGFAVEYRELADYGHTLLVKRVLPESIDWLFSKQRQ